ncbi:hypothetical protein [Plantactinospora sp. KLBMP9567]|uniref:hypothetical protein n=1 Tax=Plantactinospora sp. KLBMP9567 TaxID=3085900 RepID=UPI0029814718|nr:hypothetical protein [Plantactinospora sp. KLBMP9567]MDW5322779.1 hypothetical protein [Plantactinospora sp. KLBMP9567]
MNRPAGHGEPEPGGWGVPLIADALLRVAARRWPAELRMLPEWRAELAAIRADPGGGPVNRAVRQLRFAVSLAGSPPAEDGHGVPRGWREVLPGAGRALQPLLALLGAVLFCQVLIGVLEMVGTTLLTLARGYPGGSGASAGVDWAGNAASVAGLATGAAVAGWLGGWLGRRLPVDRARHSRLDLAGPAVLAPLLMAAGAVALHLVAHSTPEPQSGVTVLTSEPIPALLLWGVLVAPLAGAAARLVHRGRRRVASLLAVGGGLLALELVAVVAGRHAAVAENLDFGTAPWWFPLSLLDPHGSGVRFGRVEQGYVASEMVVMIVANTLRPLLACTAFALCYGMAAARTRRPVPTADAADPASAADAANPATAGGSPSVRTPIGRRSGWSRAGAALRRFGVAVAAVGLGLWAYAATVLTPGLSEVAAVDEVQSWELHLWAQELREAGVVLAVLGLLVVAAARGAVLLPGLCTAALLLAVDSVLDAADLARPGLLPAVFGVGVAVLSLGWWLGGALARRTERGDRAAVPEHVVRRRLAWVAAVAAWCAPALLFRASWPGELTPPGYPIGTALTATAFAVLAGTTALAVREKRLPVAVAAPLVGVPALLMAALGALSGGAAGEVGFAVALGPALLTVALATMVLRRRPGAVWRWAALGAGAVLLGLPSAYAQLALAPLLGEPLLRAADYGRPVDGLPYLTGAVLLAALLAVVLATRVVPGPPTRTIPEPGPNPPETSPAHSYAADQDGPFRDGCGPSVRPEPQTSVKKQ